MQRYIIDLLSEKGASVGDILGDIVALSQTAEKVSPTGEMVSDHSTQLNAKKLLLELMWVYKQKWWVSVTNKFDVQSMLFSAPQKPNEWNDVPPAGEMIQEWG